MNYDFNSFNDFTGGRYRANNIKPDSLTQEQWDIIFSRIRREPPPGPQRYAREQQNKKWENIPEQKDLSEIKFNNLNWKPVYNIADVVPYIQRENETSDIIAYVAFKLKGSEDGVTLSRPDAMCLMQWLDFPKASDPKLKQKMQMIFDVVINNALFPYPVEELI